MYPWNFDPSQQVNKYSDWNDAKYQMATLPNKDAQGNYYVTDALGKPITPPPGVTLTGPNNWARYDPSTGQTTSGTENYYPYIQTLANPNKVVTPGPAFDPNRVNFAPGNQDFDTMLATIRAGKGADAPGFTPAPAASGVSLGGGSSNVSGGSTGGYSNFLNLLSGLKGQSTGAK
jgi:hypothetical protein